MAEWSNAPDSKSGVLVPSTGGSNPPLSASEVSNARFLRGRFAIQSALQRRGHRNGGQESQCGWCKDRWGLSWQITPRALTAAISDPDPAAAKRAFDAMMTMKKIDIAAIEAARLGRS